MVSAASAGACQSNALVDTWLIPDHLAGGRSDPILASSWSVSGPCQQSINNGKKWARWHNKQKAGQACRQLGCAGLISKADMQRMRFPARPNWHQGKNLPPETKNMGVCVRGWTSWGPGEGKVRISPLKEKTCRRWNGNRYTTQLSWKCDGNEPLIYMVPGTGNPTSALCRDGYNVNAGSGTSDCSSAYCVGCPPIHDPNYWAWDETAGYGPPKTCTAWGDPHMLDLTDQKWDFMCLPLVEH